ncbi:helix-turn-helix domain-containing protein [Caldimonas sp. KR1-144]|uniref:helix-turn-helix domain-containing protein n=1 Tax=Caldimonas sp. KR1-144 TaxID=3400911 RepID=UPI003C0E61EE
MSDEASAGSAAGSAGSLLREARERQGMHIAALAAALKVAPRKLELIEADRYDELPDATFVRALALSMCRALRIDAQPVLMRLPQAADRRLEDVTRGLNQPFRDRAAMSDAIEWQRYLSAPVIGALLLVVAAVVLYLLPSRSWWPTRADAPVPASASGVAAGQTAVVAPSGASEAEGGSGVLAELAASAVQAAASVIAPPASAPAQPPVPQPPTAPAATPTAAPPAAATPVAAASAAAGPAASTAPALVTGVLKMSAQAESWVEVRDRDGRVIVQRTLAAGESVGADGALPLRVTVGNAAATQLEFRGQPVALVPLTRDNVARLELK